MKEGQRVHLSHHEDHPCRNGLVTRVAVVSSPLGSEAMAHVRWPGDRRRRAYGLPARLVEVVR